MRKIDNWDSLVLHVRGENLYSIQFRVVDVDQRDAWGAIQEFLGGVVQADVRERAGYPIRYF